MIMPLNFGRLENNRTGSAGGGASEPMGPRGSRLRSGAAPSFLRLLSLLNLYSLMQGRGSRRGPCAAPPARAVPPPEQKLREERGGGRGGGREEGAWSRRQRCAGGLGPGRNLPGEAAMCQRCFGCGQKIQLRAAGFRPLASRNLGKARGQGIDGHDLNDRGAALLRNDNVLL